MLQMQNGTKTKNAGPTSGSKPPSLKEIQEQEQNELLERKKQMTVQHHRIDPSNQETDAKNLQHFLSAWGFPSVGGDPSLDQKPTIREIQLLEAAQRELAQMEQQQKKKQYAQHKSMPSEVPWTGAERDKKPTLNEIQAEEMKQQQTRHKELKQIRKQKLKAQKENEARLNSPWVGAVRFTDSSSKCAR